MYIAYFKAGTHYSYWNIAQENRVISRIIEIVNNAQYYSEPQLSVSAACYHIRDHLSVNFMTGGEMKFSSFDTSIWQNQAGDYQNKGTTSMDLG